MMIYILITQKSASQLTALCQGYKTINNIYQNILAGSFYGG